MICIVLWGLVFCGMRGSFQRYPLHISFAYFCENPFYNRLGINPVFNIIKSAEHSGTVLPKVISSIDPADALSYLEAEKARVAQTKAEGVNAATRLEQPNVVVILMESMSSFYLEQRANGEYLTPYLRSLRERSVYCSNAYSTGIHTNNGIVGTLYGFAPNFAKSSMDVNAPLYTGLPYYLRQAGYENMAFVTGNPQYDNMNAFWRDNGITEIYSQYDYPREARVNNFGVSDGYLFEWGLKKLNEKANSEHPFFATFLTVSNHTPFVIPEAYRSRGKEDEECIVAYADDAIRGFMEAAQETSWGKNTLFILVADHGATIPTPYNMGYYGNSIPIFLVSKALQPQEITTPVSQIDIWETVLNLLGIEHENNSLGIDFMHHTRRYAFFVSNEHLGVSDGEYFYCFHILSGLESLYRLGYSENLMERESEKAAEMRNYGMNMIRANILAIENKWTEPHKP